MSKQDDVYNKRDSVYVSELMNPIKVLVVEHKNDSVASDLLHTSFFEVTLVDQFSEALTLLSDKKSEYDLLLISRDMSDVDVHAFLRKTNDMEVLSIVTSDQEDDAFVLEVLKSGAFLVLKTPLTIQALKRIRQDVIRERTHKRGKCETQNMTHKSVTPETDIEDKSSLNNFDNNLVYESSSNKGNGSLKKKIWLEWTPELCEKFHNAIRELGEKKCYPMKILKLMNVPGLTKRQVASHLQKITFEISNKEFYKTTHLEGEDESTRVQQLQIRSCKYRNKIRKSKEKKPEPTSSTNQSFSSNLSAQEVNDIKYGSMPPIETFKADQESASDRINISIIGCGAEVNNMPNQTDIGSTSMYGSSNEKNISQATEYTPFIDGNDLGSNQHEGFGNESTATAYFPEAISGIHDDGQGVDHHPFSSDQGQAYDDFLIYLDGNGLNQDLISESFSFGHDHVMQNEDTAGCKNHI